jgi:hypothetical protein
MRPPTTKGKAKLGRGIVIFSKFELHIDWILFCIIDFFSVFGTICYMLTYEETAQKYDILVYLISY